MPSDPRVRLDIEVVSKVHTPDPGDEHPGAAGALAGTLLNAGAGAGLEAAPSRTPLVTYAVGVGMVETATDPEGRAYSQLRERRALDNENTGEAMDRVDAIMLRGIVAAYGRVYPLPTDDRLASV